MIVSFVGGPLHNKHEDWESSPSRHFIEVEGEIFQYDLQFCQGASIGFRKPLVFSSSATYALANMPEDEYQRLLREVESEPSD